MPSNQDLQALRNLEVYPPFSEVRTLVLNHKEAAKLPPMFYIRTAAEGLAIIGVLVLSRLFSGSPEAHSNFTTATHVAQSHPFGRALAVAGGTPAAQGDSKSAVSHASANTLPIAIHAHRNAALPDRADRDLIHPDPTVYSDPAVHSDPAAHSDPAVHSDPTVQETPQPTSVSSVVNSPSNTPAFLEAHVPPRRMTQAKGDRLWTAFVAGAPLALTTGSVEHLEAQSIFGVRYGIADHYSILIQLERTSITRSTIRNTAAYRDTIISLNGTSFTNTLGGNVPNNLPTTSFPISLASGLRWEMTPTAWLSPFAEALIGGNTAGLLATGNAGVQFARSDWDFDLSIRAERLMASGLAPITDAALSVALSYCW